jgi:hypothetical protein
VHAAALGRISKKRRKPRDSGAIETGNQADSFNYNRLLQVYPNGKCVQEKMNTALNPPVASKFLKWSDLNKPLAQAPMLDWSGMSMTVAARENALGLLSAESATVTDLLPKVSSVI